MYFLKLLFLAVVTIVAVIILRRSNIKEAKRDHVIGSPGRKD